MGWPEYKNDLINQDVDVDYILDKYFHTGPSHVFHGAAPGEEAKPKETVAGALLVNANGLGSAPSRASR